MRCSLLITYVSFSVYAIPLKITTSLVANLQQIKEILHEMHCSFGIESDHKQIYYILELVLSNNSDTLLCLLGRVDLESDLYTFYS